MGSSTRELASAVRHKSTQIPQQHLPSGDPSRRATMVGGAAGGSCPKGSPTPRRPGERGRPQSPPHTTKEPQPEAKSRAANELAPPGLSRRAHGRRHGIAIPSWKKVGEMQAAPGTRRRKAPPVAQFYCRRRCAQLLPTSPPAATRLSAKEKPSEDAQLIPRRRPQFLRPFYKSTRRKRGSRCRPAADPRGSIALPAAEKRLLIPGVQRLFVPSSAGRARQRQRCPPAGSQRPHRRRRRHGKEAKTDRKARQAGGPRLYIRRRGHTERPLPFLSPPPPPLPFPSPAAALLLLWFKARSTASCRLPGFLPRSPLRLQTRE